ncbi:basic membrane lipoprotein Med (substrate-binding protein (PBP1-ABC) superfamily) [Actinoplanes campanulatus]|uniref:Basic membrane lipoprotein Med (Substrate-binding protein (PBP1-ABC) superfamily) n=1 Tax=Actinoplanes campanulatus TaxID=113559 RepID=A0A7W5AMB3_9ACTN|nr:basic membrane lipoprotein Med (substrate-binding protein (PBP1-ABC) superfamily) [Actinoplanes campanulatus]
MYAAVASRLTEPASNGLSTCATWAPPASRSTAASTAARKGLSVIFAPGGATKTTVASPASTVMPGKRCRIRSAQPGQ